MNYLVLETNKSFCGADQNGENNSYISKPKSRDLWAKKNIEKRFDWNTNGCVLKSSEKTDLVTSPPVENFNYT